MIDIIDKIGKFWNDVPCGVRHSKAPVGSWEWSVDVSARRYYVQPHISGFAQFHYTNVLGESVWNKKRVLEIGCGIGTDTLEFVRAGAHVDAVDLSPVSIGLAQQRIAYEQVQLWQRPRFYAVNAEEWLPPGPYDLVYSFGVLHHTPYPEKVLRLAYERLKQGGELRIMLYARWSIKWLTRQQPEAQAGCPLVRWYTVREAKALLSEAGFVVESVVKAHIFPWRIADYVEGRYVKRLGYRCIPRCAQATLERALGHHLLIVARKP